MIMYSMLFPFKLQFTKNMTGAIPTTQHLRYASDSARRFNDDAENRCYFEIELSQSWK